MPEGDRGCVGARFSTVKTCSTLVAFLAEVSRKGMPSWSAYSFAEV